MTLMPLPTWVFRAQLVRLIDAVTLEVRIDLGLRTYRVERVSLYGVEVPTRHTLTGRLATTFVGNWCKWLELGASTVLEWPLVIQTTTAHADELGRYPALVWDARDGRCLNDALLEAGMGWAA